MLSNRELLEHLQILGLKKIFVIVEVLLYLDIEMHNSFGIELCS